MQSEMHPFFVLVKSLNPSITLTTKCSEVRRPFVHIECDKENMTSVFEKKWI